MHANHVQLLSGGFAEELLSLASPESPPEEAVALGLRDIGILAPHEALVSYVDESPWERGGAETYICRFSLRLSTSKTQQEHRSIIAKAIVSLGSPPDLVAAEWLRRREVLNESSVVTPRHFGYWKGVLFQEYIPHRFVDFFQLLAVDDRTSWIGKLYQLADGVDSAGFRPLAIIGDLRTDGNHIYLVDFGQDLGAARTNTGSQLCRQLISTWLQRTCCAPLTHIESAYEHAGEANA
jgi:hypothetical protein